MKYQKLFEPISIGKVRVENRFSMAAMGPVGLGDSDGGFNQRGIDYYVERAKGGTGLIVTGVTHAANDVEIHEYPSMPCATLNQRHFVHTSKEMTERIHAYGSKIFLQVSAGFGRVFTEFTDEVTPISCSPVMNRFADIMCRPITIDEIHHIVKQCGETAKIAQHSGFDGIQIHAVHEGYLLDQFAMAYINKREDEYGGSLENRLRFAREIVEEIKRVCGDDFPVTVRYSPKSFMKGLRQGGLPGEEFVEVGRDMEEGLEVARLLVDYGYDALDVDVGCYDSWWWNHPPMYIEKGMYRQYAKAVKGVVDVPIICAGRMDDPDMAVAAIEDGTCDMIGLGRPLLADPHYVNKLRQDDVKAIRPCLSCQEGCLGRMVHYKNLSCAVNPACCRERYAQLVPALKPKNILVAGGGPAGMEVARAAALRGHHVVLCEASDQLGGYLVPGGMPSFKEDDRKLVAWYADQLDRAGVDVRLNTKVTADMVEQGEWDDVVVATGSTPRTMPLADEHTYGAIEVLEGTVDPGDNVAIIGGGLVACELALWLAKQGKAVKLIVRGSDIMKKNGPLCPANNDMLRALLGQYKVDINRGCTVASFEDGVVTMASADGESTFEADSVIECIGFEPNNSLYEELRYAKPFVHKIGDAKGVANIMNAIWEGYELGSNL